MRSYNGFTGAERAKVGVWLAAEFKAGRLRRPTSCRACWQDGGILDAHLENYDDPAGFIPLCVRCHLMVHTRTRNPEAWRRYKTLLSGGAVFAPLTIRSFGPVSRMLVVLGAERVTPREARAALGFTAGPVRGATWLDTLALEETNLARAAGAAATAE